MTETPTWNVRRIATELAILAIAIGVSYGVVELLRYAFDIPKSPAPVLAIIALAVPTARLGFTEWLRKLFSSRS